MERLRQIERWCLWGHVLSMAFGLAGLLVVMPHPELLEPIPAGPMLYTWSLAGGGVAYILMGTVAVALYAYRTLGRYGLLTFLIPALTISLGAELLGTSTGFPFGDYSYLNGLGYKVSGLVPFTIPLSWFYLGISAYLLARGCLLKNAPTWGRQMGAIAIGALLLMSWDFVLDPAMSQTAMPFWYWHTPGAFFGMPYQNFLGWFGTGAIFMTVAALLWRQKSIGVLNRQQLTVPLIIYLANFVFAMVMSLAGQMLVPVLLGLLVGATPALICWRAAAVPSESTAFSSEVDPLDMAGNPVGMVMK
ncbi:MAG: carotenoid biosynthesis protein [Cyanobacteria bacterium]|nr:carotenoid biosynthesis protein [Cyanobacteriota bacterium]